MVRADSHGWRALGPALGASRRMMARWKVTVRARASEACTLHGKRGPRGRARRSSCCAKGRIKATASHTGLLRRGPVAVRAV
eukprot:1513734-Lingulodinium_polyedra.AAC.1